MPLDASELDGRNPVGQLFRHFKGGLYRVLHRARSAEDLRCYVIVYQSEEDGRVWARRENDFFARLPVVGHRFTKVPAP